MARFFNTTGPCDPNDHYMLPPERRMPDLLPLIEQKLYFVVHAPRQTGKTTAMRALAERLRGLGQLALWATLETSQGEGEVSVAEPRWMDSIAYSARLELPPELRPPPRSAVEDQTEGERLRAWLSLWSEKVAPRPLVLLLDEADVVRGPALISLLRQLRAGFQERGPGRFPVSVALIGMRDLRDYLTQAKDGVQVNPGSPFNIKLESVTLRNFTAEEVAELYVQHTAETGQPFQPEAIERAFYWSQGQPFLVNALARIAVTKLVTDRARSVTAADIDSAKEELILSRTTHLDSLAERLKEPRVARVVEAVLTGDLQVPYGHDDFQYVLDLGLLRRAPNGAEPANPIYREVLVRQVTYNVQENLRRPWWRWQTPEGRLDFPALIESFRAWWRENADVLAQSLPLYPEAVPHLAFMAFLQRVVNGGGQVHREYAAGRGAVDLLVCYGPDRFVVELKRVRPRDSLKTVRDEAIRQTSAYLDRLGMEEGWILLFDQRPGRTWRQRLWAKTVEEGGHRLLVRGA